MQFFCSSFAQDCFKGPILMPGCGIIPLCDITKGTDFQLIEWPSHTAGRMFENIDKLNCAQCGTFSKSLLKVRFQYVSPPRWWLDTRPFEQSDLCLILPPIREAEILSGLS